MGKLTFIAGMAAGYVLGARAGRKRYEQIRRTSGKVWNSGPVQKQVVNAKEVARTKAAPVVADMVDTCAGRTQITFRNMELWSKRTMNVRLCDFSQLPGTPRMSSCSSPMPS